jgi:hypothetical protein
MNGKTFITTTGKGGITRASHADGAWTVEALLAGHDVRCLATDPHRPEVVYAGIQGTGVLRSDDRGKTWQPAGLSEMIVKSVAVSPTQPDTLYAGTKPALVYVSHDKGATWTELPGFRRIPGRWLWFTPAEKPFNVAYVQGLALSPTDPNIIIAGIEFGAVVCSEDGGQTWSTHRPGAIRDCHSLVSHHTDGNWVYEGGGAWRGGAAFSRDAGRTWTQPREGLDRHYGWAVAADPARPEIWYASLAPGPQKAHNPANPSEAFIFRAEGDGPWQKLGGGLPQPLDHMPYALLTDPSAPGHLYAGLSNGDVWHSTDYGDSWQQLPLNLGSIERAMIML